MAEEIIETEIKRIEQILRDIGDSFFGTPFKVYRSSESVYIVPILRVATKELSKALNKKLKFTFTVRKHGHNAIKVYYKHPNEVRSYDLNTMESVIHDIKRTWEKYVKSSLLACDLIISSIGKSYVIRELLYEHIKVANKKFPWKDFTITMSNDGAYVENKNFVSYADPEFSKIISDNLQAQYDRYIAIKTIQRFTNDCYAKSDNVLLDVARIVTELSPESYPEKDDESS